MRYSTREPEKSKRWRNPDSVRCNIHGSVIISMYIRISGSEKKNVKLRAQQHTQPIAPV